MDLSDQVIRSHRTLCEMFVDRSAHNPELYADLVDEIQKITPSELAKLSLQHVFLLPLHAAALRVGETSDGGIRVVYTLHPKFRIADIKRVLTTSGLATAGQQQQEEVVILVSLDKPSSTHLRNLKTTFPRIQVFQLSELLYNVTKHELVPKHEVINEAEVARLLAKFNLKTKQQLPHILNVDPVARYLALRPGQVVKITRPSPSAGEYICYRCCI